MSEEKKSIPLAQLGWEEHLAKIRREKIGDARELEGLTPSEGTVIVGADTADQKAVMNKVVAALREIYDPEIPLNVYDLGLIYKLIIEPTNAVKVEMTLTAPGCPVAGEIVAEVKRKIEAIDEVPKAAVELVWEPAWTRERLSEAARLELGLM